MKIKVWVFNITNLLVDISALKAIVAAVTFMLRNAAKYNVKPEIVSLELQQLGLPKSKYS